MTEAHSDNDRLLDLLASYATQNLTSDERIELRRLLEQEDGVSEDEFETAAAAMHLAMRDTQNDTLPAGLAEKIVSEAHAFFSEQSAVASAKAPQPTTGTRFHWREGIAWLAAALALLVAFGRLSPDTDSDPKPGVPTVQESYAALVAEDGSVQLPWQVLDDPTAAGASGDIVWNNESQTGFMKMVNLGINDPTKFQYQLWIFDKTQDDPIDGGVFDITDKDQFVPIDPKLMVREPFQFAVTVERPGGVPKSAKERIPLLAVIKAG